MSFRCSLLLCLFALTATLALAQKTTLSSLTSNNTSACASGSGSGYCQAAFDGMSDATGATYNAAPGHVSTVDIHTLLYSGNTTKIFAYFEPWFCMSAGSTVTGSGSMCKQHIQVGYNSDDSATVHAQASDMIGRGFDGVVADWSGTTLDSSFSDTITKLRDDLNSRCTAAQQCPLLLALMEDQSSFEWTSCPMNGGGVDQTSCITTALDNDLDYMNANFFDTNAYLRVENNKISATGKPVVLFFMCEECFTNPAPNWTLIWNSVRAHVNVYGSNTPTMFFIFRNSDGFSHVQTNGAYAWVNWYGTNDLYGLNYLDVFYDTALGAISNNPNLITFGGGWKGFNETNAPWVTGTPRIMQQQCGQTWLQTFQQATHNADFGTAHQLPFAGVATWNDYEEGTEIETGIDNCLKLTANVSGTTLSWTPVFSDPSGSEDTVYQYVVYDSTDGQNLTQVGTAPSGTHSIDLAPLKLAAGDHILYVEAVGLPSILNKVSNAVSYQVPGPAAMSSPTAGATLAGSTQTFTWTAGTGVTEYWLWIGSTPGSENLYDANENLNTSVTVNNLPMTGATLYVRLFSWINGGWQYHDYTYTAATQAPAAATMSSPASGSILSGAQATYVWTSGTGVSSYWIWIGTAPGTYNLYDASQGTKTTATISGLPVNGSTVYLRLFSWINGAWQHNDYTYVATSTPATMISPLAGTAILGSTAQFSWTTGSGPTEYWLWIGTAPGTYNLYDANQGTNTKTTVSGLPANGSTIYVRLFSWINGAWQWSDYSYVTEP